MGALRELTESLWMRRCGAHWGLPSSKIHWNLLLSCRGAAQFRNEDSWELRDWWKIGMAQDKDINLHASVVGMSKRSRFWIFGVLRTSLRRQTKGIWNTMKSVDTYELQHRSQWSSGYVKAYPLPTTLTAGIIPAKTGKHTHQKLVNVL